MIPYFDAIYLYIELCLLWHVEKVRIVHCDSPFNCFSAVYRGALQFAVLYRFFFLLSIVSQLSLLLHNGESLQVG